jgi:exodeoxyribonuclease-3
MRLASWNVNSLRVRLPHLLAWLDEYSPDLLGLQEVKVVNEKFPFDALEAAGYQVIAHGQPTYNGVAILAKENLFQAADEIVQNNPYFPDEQKRVIAATYRFKTPALAERYPTGIRFINVYVPNGSEVGSEKFAYKLSWLAGLQRWLTEELNQHPHLCMVGDYNIAPEDQDVHDPEAWREKILCSSTERREFKKILDLGLTDAFRLFEQPAQAFSWWDYRQGGFRRNHGLRIDHLLLSSLLARQCTASGIDTGPRKKTQPSDHAPVWADVHAAE